MLIDNVDLKSVCFRKWERDGK